VRVSHPKVPLAFARWFETGIDPPLEYWVDGCSRRIQKYFKDWRAEAPRQRRESLAAFLHRVGAAVGDE
jgi:hypothetical protein